MLVSARDIKPGDVVKGSDSPVKNIAFANGKDGKPRHMIGGESVETAYALRITFEDGTEAFVHPGKELLVLSRVQLKAESPIPADQQL